MAKSSQWLLNTCVFLLLAHSSSFGQEGAGTGQCFDEKWRSGVTDRLFKNYYYPGPEWQNYCDSILQICPGYGYIWQIKAMPSIKNGIYEVAFYSLAHAVAIDPQKQLPYQAFLKCIFAKDYEAALQDFDSSEKMVRGGGLMDHNFSFYRGLCHLGLEAPEKAILEFESDLADQIRRSGAGNEHYNSLFYLGLSYLLAHQEEKAEEYLKLSIRAYARFPEANFYLGKLYGQSGQKDLARLYLVQAGEYLAAGASMNEDNNFYVDYPYQVGQSDIQKEISLL